MNVHYDGAKLRHRIRPPMTAMGPIAANALHQLCANSAAFAARNLPFVVFRHRQSGGRKQTGFYSISSRYNLPFQKLGHANRTVEQVTGFGDIPTRVATRRSSELHKLYAGTQQVIRLLCGGPRQAPIAILFFHFVPIERQPDLRQVCVTDANGYITVHPQFR